MRTVVGHAIGVATLGFTLSAWALSGHAEEVIHNGAVIGGRGSSENQNNKIDFEHAKPLPLPVAPDSVAAQAEKDLIDHLTNRNRSSIPAPAGQETGSEGDGTTNPVQLGTPSAAPNTSEKKRH